MKKHPKVSIIIPVYNGKDYVKEAIESALNQTYDNIEIIVVNDGSNDNGATRKIANSYGNKIKYYEKQNGGVSTALNLALEKMTGEYFSWLSHDDRYYKNKIESQINYIQNYDEKCIIYSDYDLMDENSNIYAKSTLNHNELIKKPEYALLRGAINGITLLIPKSAFNDCGYFKEELRCTQDYDLWLTMILKGYRFIHQPEILATTRIHKMQTGNTSPKMLTEGYDLWIDIIEKFSDKVKIRLDKTIYNYYNNILNFMKTTPYEDVVEYLNKKLETLEKEYKKKSENIKVSIIIPYYNSSQSKIKRAIDSVKNQTHKKLEIIIMSSEKEENINKKLFEGQNIKLIELKDNKDSNYKKIGIENATGDYIAFLDSEDSFLPNKIEEQLMYMQKIGSDFCYTSYFRKDMNDESPIKCESDNIISECLYNCTIVLSTVMIKKDSLIKNKIKYDKNIECDEIFYLEIFKRIEPDYYNGYLSNIYINNASSDIIKNKKLLSIKNILKYVLIDEYYSTFENEISKLCYKYYNTVTPVKEKEETTPTVKNITIEKTNRFIKYFNILKKRGPIYCIKKFYKKTFKK